MNILLISFSIGYSMGDNFRTIASHLAQRNNTYVLTNEGITCEDVKTNNICCVKFDKTRPLDFINPSNYIKIQHYISNTKYDIAFVYSPHPVNSFVYLCLDLSRTFVYVHDHIEHSGVRLLDKLSSRINLFWAYHKVSTIIVSCNHIKDEILRLKLIEDPDRIKVVYLGLLDNLVFPYSAMTEKIDVLFFGRIEYYKGLDVLVETAKLMPNINFVIAGKGDLNRTFGISHLPTNCTHINRFIPNKELARLIQNALLVVLPYRDATGTQTIQSVFYYSKPIIATNVGCFPEYIDNNVDGIIVRQENPTDLFNAIDRILKDDDLRLDMGRNGKRKLNTIFSNDNITKQYEKVFSRNI